MADILIMRRDNSGTSDMTYKKGMIVDIFPDGKLGPGNQQHSAFVIVRVPGVTKEELAFLLEGRLGSEEDDGTGRMVRRVTHRRRDILDDIKLPAQVRQSLQDNREVTINVTAQQIQNYITRLYDDAP